MLFRSRPFLAEVTTEPGRLRIALATRPLTGGPVDAECVAAARDAAALMASLGHEVEEAAPTIDADAFNRAFLTIVAAEVANAALTVQSNLKRVEAATAARELAQKRLEAEQSKFDVGMSTNFFVVQAQRDLRDAQNTELRALADYRKSLVNFERAQQAPAGGGGGAAATTAGQ